MANVTSAGLGSGLDVASIVSQLVAAERAPADKRLATAQTQAKVQISALAAFRSNLANLKTAAAALQSGGSNGLAALNATSANTELFTAKASSSAVAGQYSIEVLNLASASKLASQSFASASSVVGNGTVEITVGSSAFTVTLSDGENTLADLRSKINAASDNTGVGAAIVSDAGGARLLLTSRETGLSHSLGLSSSLVTTSVVQPPADDARIKIDGFSYSSASNEVSGAIDGLTFSLSKAAPGTQTALRVGLDQATATAAVQKFVTAYNNVNTFILSQSRYDPSTKQGGTLLGDAAVVSASQRLRSIAGSVTADGGVYSTLTALGVSTDTDGTLKVDGSKLSAALSGDFTAVQRLLGGENGIATKLADYSESLLGSSGQLQSKTDGLNARLATIAKDQTMVDRRIASYQSRIAKQFNALDTLVSQLKTTSDYLTQQLSRL